MEDAVCVCSAFRDSVTRRNNELQRYFERWSAIDYPFDRLRFSFVEGDSTDRTYEKLKDWVNGPYKDNCILEKLDLHVPYYGSVNVQERWVQIALTSNKILDNADAKWGNEIDWYLWIESDLIFDPSILKRLIKSAKELDVKFLSPMIYLEPPDGRFYDTLAFIDWEDKTNYINDPPYHRNFQDKKPMRMTSVGSCMLMHRDVIQSNVRWDKEKCIVELCTLAEEKGFQIWLDPTITILHPL